MDSLTERLHEAAEELSGPMAAPDQVRRSAERARRIRRVVTGSAAAGLLLVVSAFGFGGLGAGDRAELAPAGPVRVWAPPVATVFTADPVMPKAGWVAINKGAWASLRDLDAPEAQPLEDDEGIVMTGSLPRPLACITDPWAMGADEVAGAALVQPGHHNDAVPSSGTTNEYVLWFGNDSDAQRAFADLRTEFEDCRSESDPTYRVDDSYLIHDQETQPPIEEQFIGQVTRVAKNAGSAGYSTGLSVGRIGGLVVIHESLDAPVARPPLTLLALTIYALDRVSPTVAPPRYDNQTT